MIAWPFRSSILRWRCIPSSATMQEYSISKCTRKCAISGRGLEPGEKYVSVIVKDGQQLARIDIAGNEWKGSHAGAIGWWLSTMPAAAAKKLRPAPNGVLLDTLSELVEEPGKEMLAYMLALLLIRRRVLQEEQSHDGDQSEEEQTHWNLVCSADGRQWSVPLVTPQADDLSALQEELRGLLFTEE
jgi:hypothetical protein